MLYHIQDGEGLSMLDSLRPLQRSYSRHNEFAKRHLHYLEPCSYVALYISRVLASNHHSSARTTAPTAKPIFWKKTPFKTASPSSTAHSPASISRIFHVSRSCCSSSSHFL